LRRLRGREGVWPRDERIVKNIKEKKRTARTGVNFQSREFMLYDVVGGIRTLA
jgi:hypothetical protein